MSGWIKLEKDLREDVRVRRMATALSGNASALQGVTLVIGALALLWMHADSFARDDDSVSLTVDEIDEITGVKGFAKLMPREWLQVINAQCVKLPGFHEHNGTDAKRKALTAKRVAQHRIRAKRSTVTTSNAGALPDQDQTKTRPDQIQEARAALVLHESLPSEEWEQWLEHRRKKRWPIDAVTLRKQLEVLSPLDTASQRECINRSINAGWQGIFPPKQVNGSAKVTRTWRPGPEEGGPC